MFVYLSSLSFTTLAFVFISSRLWGLAVNYRIARRIGLPIVILPFSWQDTIWNVIGPNFLFLRKLPFHLGDWVEYSLTGWVLQDRYRKHATLGPAFIFVTPSRNEVFVADAVAGEQVLTRYKDWIKSEELYQVFSIFGSNVVSVNGKAWQRHRKIVGPAFKEATNKIVWDEAGTQTTRMMQLWSSKAELDLQGLSTDCAHLVMKVLMAAGFGKRSEDDESNPDSVIVKSGGHTMTYYDSLRYLLDHMMLAILFHKIKTPDWLLPGSIRKLLTAYREFGQYTTENIDAEKKAIANDKPKDNLLSAMVQANESAHEEDGAKMILSDSELHGNLFILSLAGFETTATTLTYALPLLAVHQDVQEWVAEEVRNVMGDEGSADYEQTFPQLVRTMAVMHETLRLWGSVQALARYTDTETQTLSISTPNPSSSCSYSSSSSYTIPPRTYVTVNLSAIHSNPSTWGTDALIWRPQRWMNPQPQPQSPAPATTSSSPSTSTPIEILIPPPEDAAFLPWATGPRICPGKKFSQVEFAAVLSRLLQTYKILPAKRGDETQEEARKRLEGVVQDSVFNLSPKMRRAEGAGVGFERRR